MTKQPHDIELFGEHLCLGRLKDAAKMYFDLAYMHQKSFNVLLESYGVKETVIGLMHELPQHGEYVDQM